MTSVDSLKHGAGMVQHMETGHLLRLLSGGAPIRELRLLGERRLVRRTESQQEGGGKLRTAAAFGKLCMAVAPDE